MASKQLQNILDAIENNGRFDWCTFGEDDATELGFENRKALVDAALACDSSVANLEVNAFYGAVRNKPTKNVRNIEVGRVAVCTYGEHYGKSMVITDVVDQARVVVMGVDGQLSDIKPQDFPIKRLHLTSIRDFVFLYFSWGMIIWISTRKFHGILQEIIFKLSIFSEELLAFV